MIIDTANFTPGLSLLGGILAGTASEIKDIFVESRFKEPIKKGFETLINIIEASIINLIEREINKTKLSEKDKLDLNTIFTNVRNKTLN